jgi:protein transport protein SEC24
LNNQNVFEGVLNLRYSDNFILHEYITPVLLYNKTSIYFPNLDSEQNYSFLLDINTGEEENKNIVLNNFFYLQGYLYYSPGDGKKRVRVYNLCIPVSSNVKEIYESINPEVMSSFLSQYMIMLIYRNKNLVNSVNDFEKKIFALFSSYFNNMNMVKKELDEKMKLLSLYLLGLMKNCLFDKSEKGYNNDIDLSSFYLSRIQKMKIEEILCFIYPKIYVLDNLLSLQDGESPPIINNNKKMMKDSGTIFLIDNGFELILYLKNNADKYIINSIFGVNEFNEIKLEDINESNIFDYDENKNEFKQKIIEIIDTIRNGKSLFQNLNIIFEGINDKNGNIINEILVEDNYNKGYPYNYEKFYNKIIFD